MLKSLLWVHIAAGIAAVLIGALAVAARKGGRLHTSSGEGRSCRRGEGKGRGRSRRAGEAKGRSRSRRRAGGVTVRESFESPKRAKGKRSVWEDVTPRASAEGAAVAADERFEVEHGSRFFNRELSVLEYNARLLACAEDARRRGVITASAGNFAQGLGYVSQRLRVQATAVVPETAAA